MSKDYSTIQQHQPLRTPKSFDKEGRALVLQIDEVFDDIYRRFGRLRIEDMGKAFRKEFADAEGNISQLTLDVNGLSTRVQSAEGDISQLNVWAGAIELQVADKYDKVSGITITSAGIDITGSKYIQMGAGSSIDILSGGTFTVASGNFGIDAQGNAYFNGGGTFSGNLQAAGGTFTGNLQAAGGTFAGTLSADCIQGGTIDADEVTIVNLKVDYAQMLGATVGDLVVQASDGNYYRLDVAADGTVTAVRVYPTAAEIAQGHTNDGQKIYGGTDIPASELTTTDIYESRDLAGKITGSSEVDVDQMFERQDFNDNMNAQDLTENTSFQEVVGDWSSQSTITQTINGINSRITQLGYGTIFYSTTPPDPSGVVVGDIWVEPIEDNTWDDISQYTWDELGGMTWEQVAGQYRMYVWTGNDWKLLFDNMIISELQTEINQNAYAITLKANQTQVNVLSGQVTEFAATLEVQGAAITAAVSSVNSKTSNYVRLTDPSLDPSITLSAGDTWTKSPGNGTWESLATFTWNELADLTWDELAGASVYTWDGTQWVQTGNYGMVEQHQTLLEMTDRQISLMADEQIIIGDKVDRNTAQITIQADRITQEVSRATSAEEGKISKTVQFQTADQIYAEAVSQSASSAQGLYLAKTVSYQTPDAIVTEAVRQAGVSAGNTYLKKTSVYQTADAIVSTASAYADGAAATAEANAKNASIAKSGSYNTVNDLLNEAQNKADAAATTAKNASIAKTETYQSAQSIVNTAVAAAASSAGQTYIAKTSTYQTADAIVNEAKSYTNNKLTDYSTTVQTSSLIAQYVGNNAYGKVSGITITASGIDISGSQYVKIASGGYLQAKTGNFGIDTNSSDYVLWSGASTAASSNFRLKKNGELTVTKLMVLNESGSESEYNLRTGNLWKLNYQTIKQGSITTSGGYCTSFTLSNGTTVNFKSAASVTLSGAWDGSKYTATASNGQSISETFGHDSVASELSGATETITSFSSGHKATAYVTASSIGGGNGRLFTFVIDATSEYNSGVTSGRNGVTLSAAGWVGGSNVVSASNGKSVTVALPAISLTGGTSFTSHKTTVYASGGGSPGAVASIEVDATSEYNAGWIAGYNAAASHVGVSGGAGYNNGSFSFPVATSAAGTESTGSWTIRADVSNPQRGYFTGEAQIDGVVRAQRTRQFSQ